MISPSRLSPALALAALAACSSSPDLTPPVVTLPHNSLYFHFRAIPVVANAIPGDTVHFAVDLSTNDSIITPTASGPGMLRWATSDPGIGTIDQAGNFVGRSPGHVTLLAMIYADTGKFDFTVVPPAATARIIAPGTTVVVPASFVLRADLRSAAGDSLTTNFRNLSWTSSDTNVAVVEPYVEFSTGSENARITFKTFGQATVTLTALDEGVSTSTTFSAPPVAFRKVAVDGDGGSVEYACGLDPAGHAYCWGTNLPDTAFVWYGYDRSTGAVGPPVPTPVPTLLTFDSIAVAYDHACGLTSSGDAWCWGNDNAGSLGNGASINSWINVPVEVVGGHKFIAIDVAVGRSCGVTAQGDAWCWGNNSDRDEFGNGVIGAAHVPVPAATGAALRSISLARLTLNGGASCGESIAGSATCWSANELGQVGVGHPSVSPEPPTAVAAPETLVSVRSGGEHTCGLTATGKAYCWGSPFYGVLTLPDNYPTPHPTPVAILSSLLFEQISVAPYQTCGLALDATVWCWGNSWGTAPVEVVVPGTVTDLYASYVTDCAITTTQQAWCWTVHAHLPVKVVGQQ